MHYPYTIICLLLYEAIEDEMAEVCFVLHNAHSVPLVNIAPGKAFRRCCNKQYRLRLCTTETIARRCGLEANIVLGFTLCYISLSTTPLCNIPHSALTVVLKLVRIDLLKLIL